MTRSAVTRSMQVVPSAPATLESAKVPQKEVASNQVNYVRVLRIPFQVSVISSQNTPNHLKVTLPPDPSNCLQYIHCDAQKQAQTVRCSPSSYVYDHSTRSCKQRQTSNDCFQVNCALASNLNRWTSYRPVPKLAFYCSIAVGPMTFECSTGENQVFNVVSRSCVFGCPSEGRFPVPDDGTKYYQCARGVYGVVRVLDKVV